MMDSSCQQRQTRHEPVGITEADAQKCVKVKKETREPALLVDTANTDSCKTTCQTTTASSSLDFRLLVRNNLHQQETNSKCPGRLQCNLVVLPRRYAFDFLLFCQRNQQACPLIQVCDSPIPPPHVAQDADLRMDLPKYAIYKHGKLEKEVLNVTDDWPNDGVAFLIGCSFTFDDALAKAGIELPPKIPMYKTNIQCKPAGIFHGNVVVSMRPIRAMDVAKHVQITSRYPHAHGPPVCVGCPFAIGIEDLGTPDWGPPIQVQSDQVPVFHACGVTPQNVILESKIPFCITHVAGHMFVTDLSADNMSAVL